MAVICIARELGSLGEEMVRDLTEITGFQAIDKEYIENRMAELGVRPEIYSKYDERKPGFLASLSQDRDDYLHYLKSVLFQEATKGDRIICGRGGFAVFDGVPGIISVKLVAPRALRIKRLMEHFKCDERKADAMIKQSDHDRRGFHDYFYNKDWNDPANFDLVINTARESPATAAGLIDHLRQLVVSESVEKACVTRLKELCLGQQVVTHVIYTKKVPIHFLEADVTGSKVVLHGVANTQGAIDAAGAAAMTVEGVEVVENAIQIVQEFAVLP